MQVERKYEFSWRTGEENIECSLLVCDKFLITNINKGYCFTISAKRWVCVRLGSWRI
jgi:hypothetical protein